MCSDFNNHFADEVSTVCSRQTNLALVNTSQNYGHDAWPTRYCCVCWRVTYNAVAVYRDSGQRRPLPGIPPGRRHEVERRPCGGSSVVRWHHHPLLLGLSEGSGQSAQRKTSGTQSRQRLSSSQGLHRHAVFTGCISRIVVGCDNVHLVNSSLWRAVRVVLINFVHPLGHCVDVHTNATVARVAVHCRRTHGG